MKKWASRVLDDTDIDRTPEYDEFIRKLQEYHDKRGTTLQREPELGRKKLDLLKLYKRITSAGGYDKCTLEKGAWRDIAQSYKLAANNTNAGYLLKTIYYKNLAAFEISDFFKREPPPKEVLEDRSAAGGPVMGRTLENYKEASPSAEPTVEEKSSSPQVSQENPNTNSTGRSLRQAPPQRQFYQPPVATPRSASKMANSNSQQPQQQQLLQTNNINNSVMSANTITNSSVQSSTWTPPNSVPTTYSGTSIGPIPMPVRTPGNAPDLFFAQKRKTITAPTVAKCGAGHTGPALMTRIVMSMKSGISDEIDYALHNLVRISYEAGDNLKAEEFPGMTEALIQELSSITRIPTSTAVSNGHSEDGPTIDISDTMEPKRSREKLDRTLEAALVLRNMSILVDNAKYMARFRTLIDALVYGITLPPPSYFIELKHYCLDIAEALSSHLVLVENEALYRALRQGLLSDDRSILMSSMRGITRLVGRDETNRLSDIDPNSVHRIQDLLLLEDEDLASTCLDFLYSYTAVDDNVTKLMSFPDALQFLKQLKRLLLHQAQEYINEFPLRTKRKDPPPQHIPTLPPEIVNELLSFPEPDRATKWMRCCFEEDPEADITQIALWQAYQARFTEFVPKGRPLLPAADFIKNVSVAFSAASAMVISVPMPPGGQKFIIKGIKPRATPLSVKGIEYLACKWSINQLGQIIQCPCQLPTPNDLFAHILDIHLKPPPPGTAAQPLSCEWAGCNRFPKTGVTDRRMVIAHVRTHMPDRTCHRDKLGPLPQIEDLPQYRVTVKVARTSVDERGEAAGLALTAALVLRNIARASTPAPNTVTSPSTSASTTTMEPTTTDPNLTSSSPPDPSTSSPTTTFWDFASLDPDIHAIAALNAPLAEYIYDLLMVKFEAEQDREMEEREKNGVSTNNNLFGGGAIGAANGLGLGYGLGGMVPNTGMGMGMGMGVGMGMGMMGGVQMNMNVNMGMGMGMGMGVPQHQLQQQQWAPMPPVGTLYGTQMPVPVQQVPLIQHGYPAAPVASYTAYHHHQQQQQHHHQQQQVPQHVGMGQYGQQMQMQVPVPGYGAPVQMGWTPIG